MEQPNNVIPLAQGKRPKNAPESAPGATGRQRRSFGWVRKLPSGRYQASYAADGERFLAPVTFDNKGDAGAWLDMRHAELLEYRWKPPAPPEPDTTTLRDYSARWLDSRRNRHGEPLKPRTKALYRGLLDGCILPELGDYAVPEITPEMVDDWYDELLPDAPTRRAHAYTLLHSIMKSAATGRRRLIEVNPCMVEHATKADRASVTVPAEIAEVDAIAQAMPDRLKAAVLIAAWGGLRFGELTELRRQDVEVGEKRVVIHVRRAVVWLRGETIVQTPKSAAGVRSVNLPASLRRVVVDHLEHHTGPGKDALLFPALQGGHLNNSSLMKPYRKARAAAGRPDLRWHDLRHVAGTEAARAGATTRETMARLGHSTVEASMKYQHAASRRDEEIADRLDAEIRRARKAAKKSAKTKGQA